MTYLILAIAIVTEVTATMLLKASNGWEKWAFGYSAIFFYAVSGMLFAFVLKNMGVGIAYAIWSGMGYSADYSSLRGILETNIRHLCRAGVLY